MRSIEYSNKILNGEIVSGRYIKKACQRFLKDLERDDLYVDHEELDKIYRFIENTIYIPELRVKNKVPLPHCFWIDQLYGFKYKSSGLRRFNSVYIQVARKNFKTFYAAIVSLVELLIYHDTYPEILQGANSRDQALICTEKTGEIIKKSPKINNLWDNNAGNLKMYTYKEQAVKITFENSERRGKIEAMPKDPGDGGNPSVGIVDEFHEAKTTKLLETIKSGQGQRLEPLTLIITSPGSNKDGPCYAERTNSVRILDGDIEDDRHLGVLWELDSEDEWDNIEMLEKSNPMIAYSKTLKPFLEDRIKEAKKYGGSIEANIKIKNSGIWVDAPDIWIDSQKVEACNFGEEEYNGQEVYVGIDLARGVDLNTMAVLWKTDKIFTVKMYYWIPTDKYDTDEVDYRKWVNEGYIFAEEGNTINHWNMAEQVADILEGYNVKVIGYDPKYANMGVVPVLAKAGYEDILIPVGQGQNLHTATIQLETLIREKEINLMNNPVLKWNFRNVVLNTGPKGYVYPDKSKSIGRIDGVVAICNAMTEYLRLNADYEMEVYVGGFNLD